MTGWLDRGPLEMHGPPHVMRSPSFPFPVSVLLFLTPKSNRFTPRRPWDSTFGHSPLYGTLYLVTSCCFSIVEHFSYLPFRCRITLQVFVSCLFPIFQILTLFLCVIFDFQVMFCFFLFEFLRSFIIHSFSIFDFLLLFLHFLFIYLHFIILLLCH